MTDRYEVTGNSPSGLQVEYPMAVASTLGARLSDAFAPADGSIGKVQATTGADVALTARTMTQIHLNELVNVPIDAVLDSTTGIISLLAPGEWTIDSKVRFGAAGDEVFGAVMTIVKVMSAAGEEIRVSAAQGVAVAGGAWTVLDRMVDVLVPEGALPAQVIVQAGSYSARTLPAGAGNMFLSAKKTTRFGESTDFTQGDLPTL